MVTLQSSRLFCGLNPAELQALSHMARERSFGPRQQIFREGDQGDGIYIVKEGLVEISTAIGSEERHVLSEIGPGDFFGEMAVLDYQPRSACAMAARATEVFFIPRADILELIEGSPALAFRFLREISQRLRDFDRKYLREVVQAERLAVVGRFARSILHDLKNPLTLIGLTVQRAGSARVTDQERERALVVISREVQRISELAGEILEFTQGAAPDLVLTAIDYAEFVGQVIEQVRGQVALNGVTLEVEGELPSVRLRLHPERLARVFSNLVQNAIDLMPERGRIRVRVIAHPAEVVTEVQDDGPGIAPEMDGRLFEAFATFGKPHGTGLGLSICKRILAEHNGWIAAKNQPGGGAVFSFGLPRTDFQPR